MFIEGRESPLGPENHRRVWAWAPEVEALFRAARLKLDETSTLSTRERAVIVCASVSALGDPYCSLACGAKLAAESDAALAAGVLRGDDGGLTSREAALAKWSRRVVRAPRGTTKDDVQGLRDAGLRENEIVEATILVGLRVGFAMVNGALGAEPDASLVEKTPSPIREVVFGQATSS